MSISRCCPAPRSTSCPTTCRSGSAHLSEPLTSCIRAFNRATRAGGFNWGDTVVIQGSGPIGILAVAAAQEMGAGRVICVGAPETPRLQLARKFGAEATVNIEEFRTPEERIARCATSWADSAPIL